MVYDGYTNYGDGLLFMMMMSMMVIDTVYDGYNNYDDGDVDDGDRHCFLLLASQTKQRHKRGLVKLFFLFERIIL